MPRSETLGVMARIARVVIPGLAHHVTQRGNHRQMVFLKEGDRQVYQDLLRHYLLLYSVRLVGYSFMGNHVHHMPIPGKSDSLAKAIGRVHQDYSRWFQVRERQTGHLWQNRFFSCVVEEERFLGALLYIELNPVRAGLVESAWEWKWSSARAHVTGIDPTGLLDMEYWASRNGGAIWKQRLEEAAQDQALADSIRAATKSGRPWGSSEFVAGLELQLGRVLRPQKRGRKSSGSSPIK